jgi:DMSO/TMAO reductase YedYZ molybdopterin-dependent catalytic subunit
MHLLLLASLFAQPTFTLSVDGDVPQPLKLTMEDLQKLPRVETPLKEHDGTVKNYEGAPLTEVLKLAGVAVGDHVRGKALGVGIEVIASDGYSVIFGLGEVEPSISGRTIIVAYAVENQPLGPSVGPIRIVVGDDKKPARCERMVTEIKVIDLSKH